MAQARDIDKIKERVQKLLNQAADRSGTPEGDVFYDKAFALMATYGFSERDLSQPDSGDDVIRTTVDFTGAYTDMQATLLNNIASALHCTAFMAGVHRSTRVKNMTIFGLRRHMERVKMLFAMLNPQMIARASKMTAQPGMSVVVVRRSFMVGFAAQVGERLRQAEETVTDSTPGYAIAVLDDEALAAHARDDYAAELGLRFTEKSSQRRIHANAYFQGVDAGNGSDIGQTRVGRRAALPAAPF